jgi:hypothetical protein
MKGYVIFYINFFPDLGQDMETIFKMIISHNKEMLDKVREHGEYDIIFVPTTKEATRVEKIDFDRPFPRFKPQSNKNIVNNDDDDDEKEDSDD